MTIQFAPTWNNSGVDLTCIKANINDIASGGGSTLIDLLVNNASKFSVNKNGVITADGVVVPKITSGTIEPSGGSDGDIYFQYQEAVGLTNYVPEARTITINNVSYDLSANRSWNINATGIASLNGLTVSPQTIVTGAAGTDFNIVSEGTVHTLNIPDASATARGVVTTDTQRFLGIKYFNSADIRLGTGTNDHRVSVFGANLYIDNNVGGFIQFRTNASAVNNLQLNSSGGIQISGSVTLLGFGSPQVLEQRSATNPQTYRIYNTFTSSTSYERLSIGWSGNVCTIATEKGSAGGSDRVLRVQGFEIPVNYTTSPNNTVNHVSLQATGSSTNVSVSIVPKGSGAFSLQVPDGTTAGGNARGANAVDLQTVRSAASQVALGSSSLAAGAWCSTGSAYTFAMGIASSATGFASAAIGDSDAASGDVSFATGRHAVAGLYASRAHAGWRFSANGDAQYLRLIASNKTTDATPAVLFLRSDQSVRPVLPAGKVWGFIANVIGSKSDGSAIAHYVRKGAIKRVGSTTTLVYVETIGTDHEDNASTDLAVTADDTNEAVQFSVTGIASEIWRWVVIIEIADLAYGT
jgi:hypothetical protein